MTRNYDIWKIQEIILIENYGLIVRQKSDQDSEAGECKSKIGDGMKFTWHINVNCVGETEWSRNEIFVSAFITLVRVELIRTNRNAYDHRLYTESTITMLHTNLTSCTLVLGLSHVTASHCVFAEIIHESMRCGGWLPCDFNSPLPICQIFSSSYRDNLIQIIICDIAAKSKTFHFRFYQPNSSSFFSLTPAL